MINFHNLQTPVDKMKASLFCLLTFCYFHLSNPPTRKTPLFANSTLQKCPFCMQKVEIYDFFVEKFAHVKKKQYLCSLLGAKALARKYMHTYNDKRRKYENARVKTNACEY